MSKGTQMYGVRISDADRALIEETIVRRNFNSRDYPWTLSDFLKIAVQEKIAKMKRCRNKNASRRFKLYQAAAEVRSIEEHVVDQVQTHQAAAAVRSIEEHVVDQV